MRDCKTSYIELVSQQNHNSPVEEAGLPDIGKTLGD